MIIHLENDAKDGRDTNPVITEILGTKPFASSNVENSFIKYTQDLGVEPLKNKRRYWRVRDEFGKLFEL